ncbi:MAG: response regulator [Pirellula sp.]|jgi:two-component system OmpR family response regulator
MLILSRSAGDGIAFPELDLAIEILKIHGNRVQVGVKASDEIRVLRSELLERSTPASPAKSSQERSAKRAQRRSLTNTATSSTRDGETLHEQELRNRINAVALAMSIAEKHLERGDLHRAELALQQIVAKLAPVLESEVQSVSESSPTYHHRPSEPSLSVLLVDDNTHDRNLIAEILELNQVDVRCARNASEAIEALHNRKPDIVLLDISMPEHNGPSTIARIREDHRFNDLPIYVLSDSSRDALGMANHRAKELRSWLERPSQTKLLLEAIHSVSLQEHETPAEGLAC